MQPASENDELRARLTDGDATITPQAKAIASLTAKVEALETLVKWLTTSCSSTRSA